MLETLVPALVANFLFPYAKKALGTLAEKVTEKFSQAAADETVEVTGKVWQRVKQLFAAKPGAEGVLADFEADPDDEATRQYLEKKLTQLLEADEAAARELAELAGVTPAGTNSSVTEIIQNSGVLVSIKNSSVKNSNVIGVNYGTVSPPADR